MTRDLLCFFLKISLSIIHERMDVWCLNESSICLFQKLYQTPYILNKCKQKITFSNRVITNKIYMIKWVKSKKINCLRMIQFSFSNKKKMVYSPVQNKLMNRKDIKWINRRVSVRKIMFGKIEFHFHLSDLFEWFCSRVFLERYKTACYIF